MEIGLSHYLATSAILFSIGLFGIYFGCNHLITILMSLEIILLSININLIAFSFFLNDVTGQIFTLLVLTVAAAETSIGLAILIIFYRNKNTISLKSISRMKG